MWEKKRLLDCGIFNDFVCWSKYFCCNAKKSTFFPSHFSPFVLVRVCVKRYKRKIARIGGILIFTHISECTLEKRRRRRSSGEPWSIGGLIVIPSWDVQAENWIIPWRNSHNKRFYATYILRHFDAKFEKIES